MKRHPLVSYLIGLSFYSIGITFIALFSLMFIPETWAVSELPYFILFFYIATGAGYSFVYYSAIVRKARFEGVFMLTKFIKTLLYLMVLIIFLFLEKSNMKALAVFYIALYALYTIFDTISFKNLAKKIK